ncbi:uncharacterized protein LOC128180570 [Crassostrea angulata]|uniref:uncharacterized protein LOC128180570 n=1 Tax=Magallana angulata TaxID=2784310 RepID=UPI0022B0A12C|nr:uncharacterized protein LOC128180570 [Crassostrea angulata]
MSSIQKAGGTLVQFVFRTSEKHESKEFQITFYKFQKLTFLVTSIKPKYHLDQILGQLYTGVVLRNYTPCLVIEFVSEYHEHDFRDWVESCLNWTEHCVRDLELLYVKGADSEINHIENAAVVSKLIGENSVRVFRMKDSDGVFLLGSVDCMVYLILELQKNFQNISFWDPETGVEVKQYVIPINTMYDRLNAIFKCTEQLVTSFPYSKLRCMGSETGHAIVMLGSHSDIRSGIDFFNSLAWLGGAPLRYCPWFEGFEFFLAREHVQSFIDGMITTQDGTWVIDSQSKLVIFGKTEEDVNAVLNTLSRSIRRVDFCIADTQDMAKNANELAIEAWKLENKYNGKCHLCISSGFLMATILFTTDLESEQQLKMLIQNFEIQSVKKLCLPRSEKQLMWIQMFYSVDLTAQAQRLGVNLNILKDNHVIELEGKYTAVGDMAGFIDSICIEERHILLPLEVLPVQPADFFSGYRCCFEYAKPEKSKFWIKGKIGIVASCCQSGFEHMYSHLKAKLVQGERRDQEIKWVGESSVLVNYPILDAGDKGNVPLPDGGLKSLFQAVKDRKKMSVAIDIQDLLPEQVHTFTKSIQNQIPGLPDGLIIVLHLLDGAMFQVATECLQNHKTSLTDGKANGLQRKTIDLQVITGKIAELPNEVDVIVNTTSPDLDITKGAVCKSILEAAGDSLKAELDKLPVINTNGGKVMRVKYGEIKETTGYRLKCTSIFHGSLYKWDGEGKAAFDVLRRFVENCLSLADDRKFKTLAFPAIGTGRLQIPPDVVATCVQEVVEEYSLSHPQTSVEQLIFVIHEADTKNFKVFKTILEKRTEVVNTVSPMLYKLTVFGEVRNIDASMTSLTELFQKHIITISKTTQAVNETRDATKTTYQKENTKTEINPDKPTKARVKENSSENTSKVSTPYVLSGKENQSVPDNNDEKCLLLQSKNNIALYEKTLGPFLKDVECESVVCPFLNKCQALVIFKTIKDADKFLGNEHFVAQKLPKQEVKDTKAKLGPKVISVLETRKMSSQEFYRRTGGTLCIQTWTVTGNLLVLQHVQKFLKDLVEEFERPEISKTWTPNAENFLTGVFYI